MSSPDEEPKSSSSSVPGHAKRLKVVCELVRHPRRAAQQAPGGSRRACCGSRDPAAGGQRHLLGSQLHTKQRQPAEHAPVAEEELVLWEGPALARDRMRAPAASPHLGHSGLSASITLAAQPLQQHWCTLHAAACEGGRLHGGGGRGGGTRTQLALPRQLSDSADSSPGGLGVCRHARAVPRRKSTGGTAADAGCAGCCARMLPEQCVREGHNTCRPCIAGVSGAVQAEQGHLF